MERKAERRQREGGEEKVERKADRRRRGEDRKGREMGRQPEVGGGGMSNKKGNKIGGDVCGTQWQEGFVG